MGKLKDPPTSPCCPPSTVTSASAGTAYKVKFHSKWRRALSPVQYQMKSTAWLAESLQSYFRGSVQTRGGSLSPPSDPCIQQKAVPHTTTAKRH